jgi:CubicO group peptidase (beta-lactamase class C family)
MRKSGRSTSHATHTTISFIKHLLPALFFLLILPVMLAPGCRNSQVSSGGEIEEPEPLVPVAPKYAEMTPRRAAVADSLRHYFDRLGKYGFNGTVLCAENGEIVFSKAYGYANLKTKDSLSMESPFQLASVSKPITALAVLILKEEGKLGIDDSVSKYIPELPYPGITIRHLLTHRSGLPNYMYFAEDDWPDKSIPLTNRDVIDLMAEHHYKPYYLPNRRYNYCNTNFSLLAYIVEKVSGMKFETFVQQRIFNPCHMVNASIYNKSVSPVNTHEVIGYPSGRTPAENSYLNGVVGDKGVYCSAYDLLMFDQALYHHTLVSDSTLRQAFRPQHKDLHINDNYGLGWRLDLADTTNPAIYHTGWWKGFRSYFIRELGEKRTIVILCNTNRSSRLNTHDLRARF